jgi:cell division protein FtsB
MTKILYNFVKKNNIKKPQFTLYFITFSVILYFSFFTIFGNKGLFRYFELKEEIKKQEIVQKELLNVIKNKENMIKGMSPESLNIDLLDEQSRKTLGYVGEKEIVIYKEEENNSK